MRLVFMINEIDAVDRLFDMHIAHETRNNLLFSYAVDPGQPIRGHLIYLHLNQTESFTWRGETLDLFITHPVSLVLHERNINKKSQTPFLVLLSAKRSNLEADRSELEIKLGSDYLAVSKETASFHLFTDTELIIDTIKDKILQVQKEMSRFLSTLASELSSLQELYKSSKQYRIGDRDLGEVLRLYFNQVSRTIYTFYLKTQNVSETLIAQDKIGQYCQGLVDFSSSLTKFHLKHGEKSIHVYFSCPTFK